METTDLNILYEDNHIIVVLKPQMVASCPDESGDTSLFDCVKEYIRITYNKPGNVYLGLVHRLDRPTGGVMVFAKTSKAAARLSQQIKERKVEKKYLAVLCGVPNKKKATLEHWLKKNSVNNTVYVATPSETGAKISALDYEIKAESTGLALAEIVLHTGRSHQIRVQTAAINCPVYGDMRYGGEKAVKGKLALWAYSLRFNHPTTGEAMRFIAEPPKDEAPWKFFDVSAVIGV